MRALTVQQPWAWAIIHGGKTIENRSRCWSYRGPVAVHAGARISDRGMTDERIADALKACGHASGQAKPHPLLASAVGNYIGAPIHLGAIIGVVDIVDAHWMSQYCCQGNTWAERSYHGGAVLAHLVLANPRPVDRPIPCRGRQGLWKLPAGVERTLVAHSNETTERGG